MYSLDVNFLNDRPAFKPDQDRRRMAMPGGDWTPLYLGLATGLFLLALPAGAWWLLGVQNAKLAEQIVALEQENQRLDAQIGDINKLRAQTNQIKAETQALVAVFDEIRPWSATLQELRDRIPQGVRIENIKQVTPTGTPAAQGQPVPNPAGTVEISGYARSFNDVNDFLLTLQQSRFFNPTDSRIVSAELVDAPIPPGVVLGQSAAGVPLKPPQVVKYTLQSSLSNVPASQLVQELERKGTVGLVTRIRTLQQKGVIQR